MSEGPKIGVLDIETLPAEVYVFDLFNQNISLAQVKVPVRVGGFGWRWLHEDRPKWYGLNHLTHEEMVEKGFALMDEADAIVTYNGDRFDIPHMNREFAELFGEGHRPSPFASIDLYKVVKKHHKFLSKKLAHVVERLELSRKLENSGWPLWIGCANGDPEAWREMETYCLGDMDAETELYYHQLVWIDNHPNVQLWLPEGDRPLCPKCGKDTLQKRGTRKTRVSEFQQFWCVPHRGGCGSWPSSGKRLRGVETR